jgi:SAM-dependent methyltransferase
VNKAKQASVEFALHWQSELAMHTDRMYYEKVNFWRDFFPGTLGERLATLAPGASDSQAFAAGELVTAYDLHLVYRIRPEQMNLALRTGEPVVARNGRFYPRGMIRDLPDVFGGDRRPFRYIGADGDRLRIDLNHPLARYLLAVEATLIEAHGVQAEHGGRSHDVGYDLTENGPGMQANDPAIATDFYAEQPFARLDDRNDALFYRQPRLVQHLDSRARERVTGIYARFLRSGMQVLDLMGSWASHLPDVADLYVTGLGLNREELDKNPRLAERAIHDLNAEPRLPFKDKQFDAVICTASVEYLVRPIEVFRDVARVLRPGGPFVLTFSDRWFPPKVVQVWTELHPFERLALVLDYFRQGGGFRDLQTESVRGLPRPEDDPYANTLALSDPVYAAWGIRA